MASEGVERSKSSESLQEQKSSEICFLFQKAKTWKWGGKTEKMVKLKIFFVGPLCIYSNMYM